MYLNNHTYYSLRYGTYDEQSLIDLSLQCGVKHFVITDINNTSACLNFVRLCTLQNLKSIVGIDFRNDNKQLYVGIARNNLGFQELNSFLSDHLHSKKTLPDRAPIFKHAYVVYPLERVMEMGIVRLRESEKIGISTSSIRKLIFTKYASYKDHLVILQTTSFRNKRDYNAHRLLRAIDRNLLLSQLPEDQQGHPNDKMIPVEELQEHFKSFPELIENTEKLLQQCSIDFNFDNAQLNENQQIFTENKEDDFKLLSQLAHDGINLRYQDVVDKTAIYERIEKELTTVKRKGFVAYFLINWEICRYARERNYFYVGRGSGANSILAYLLQITEVDPIDLDLYFERFINDYRTSPPDFDLDFSWDDREDITQFIFKRFKNTALLGTYNTFQFRAVIRELGKVFGLPKSDIDKLTSGQLPAHEMDDMHRLVFKYGNLIQGMPNYISIHAGGILITQKNIHYYSATDLPPKGFATVQFDMHIAEDAGIHKFDILAQRGLGKIRDTVSIVKYNQPNANIKDLRACVKEFKEDPEINAMISQAKCIGCFYIESPAMRMLLSKLRTHDYLGLVAASSVIRPGVAQSGMMREYILRTRYPERRKQAHPIMSSIMPDTYGIMVYQEDVIKVAHYYAKLDLGAADVLRRGMSGKYRSREEFKAVEKQYFDNCKKHGRDDKQAKEIWEQIKSFAGYAFAKGHSASYAVESYQSLYLKRYFPLEYMTATLNNGGGFYRPELYVHEAKMCGATIEAPCINNSDFQNTIKGTTVYLALGYLKELEKRTIQRLLENRNFDGPFNSFDDFINRVPISADQAAILIRINAFRFTGLDRCILLWQAYFKLNKKTAVDVQSKLFAPQNKKVNLPQLKTSKLEHAFEQMELLGFPLCSHFELLAQQPDNDLTHKDLPSKKGKTITIYGYVINIKTTHTSNRKRMQFGTFLDRDGGFFDTVMFPQVASKLRFRGSGIYKVTGKVVEEFDFYSIEVTHMDKMDYIQDPRYAEDNPQTIHRLDKQTSLRDRRLGNSTGKRSDEVNMN
ncbi:DNA polymerase III subunit alpha [Nonlabens tegetincola]|uniref:DNA polymerase III subunit alpha n=1 Tax=Nonlabens tegetincola TaxID=323273 RepID=UPI000A202435|nr:DNA polymerase III subunit alpha [Nonlabens tegetincola]ARN72362.1 DNA polymerase III subunit alpha [Nonlabens tegetincola]